ncbi:MAG: ATP-dependent protease LonB [Clostridia bacterium]|nr:ATP-dependent protease LonB [Clostridia bacterium]
MFMSLVAVVQLCFTVVIGIYFLTVLKSQYAGRNSMNQESTRELERLKKLNDIKLTMPLTEATRPKAVRDIVGQSEGIKALRCAICSKNPQHVLIYGPPGVGKTAASRVVLSEAKKNPESPFGEFSKFIEVDATTMQFDERSIADPLIGSVHDPIYQGAGAYGPAGVPQPKEGAVTKAHGGVLFIDEIGELSSIQMNKLLKVLEDRRVYFDSAYYSQSNKEIPRHIHEMFKNGLPADFRLIGATTRLPEEIPPALRSRCVEVFFKGLSKEEVEKIAREAAQKTDAEFDDGVFELVARYAENGRDAVNIVQTSESVSKLENRKTVEISDVRWVIESGKYNPRYEKNLNKGANVGRVCGLAVFGNSQGCILDIEASAEKCKAGCGTVTVTGAIEEEEISNNRQKLKRKSSILASVKNTATVLKRVFGIKTEDFDIHINFPNCMPVDGPSAGTAIFCAVYSAIKGVKISGTVAVTGEISISGDVWGVGEVPIKIHAAMEAGAQRVIIPVANWQEEYEKYKCEIIPVSNIFELIDAVTGAEDDETGKNNEKISDNIGIISAEGVEIFKQK